MVEKHPGHNFQLFEVSMREISRDDLSTAKLNIFTNIEYIFIRPFEKTGTREVPLRGN